MGNNEIFVIKRDGTREVLNISKIRKQTQDACEGLQGVSFEELELGADIYFVDGIKTSDIQNSLIETALRLNSLEKPNYIYVAGRLELYNLYHELQILYGKTKNTYSCIYDAISLKEYFDTYGDKGMSDFYKQYTDEEIEELNKAIDPKKDLLFTYPAVRLLLKTYLNRSSYDTKLGKDNKNKSFIVELPQHMFMSIAMFNCQNLNKETRLEEVKELYYILSNQYFIPATPHLRSARLNRPGLASCLVTSIADNLESITDRFRAIMFGSSEGAGFGIDISRVRSMLGPIRGISERSKGKIPMVKSLDSIALYIDQAGSRTGAFSCTIRVWDIELQAFLDIRKAQGEERLRARNIHPAVAVDDVFMSRVEEFYKGNEEITYTAFNPYDVPDLCDTYNEDFKLRYLRYEQEFLKNPENFCPGTEVRKVKDILRMIIRSIATEQYPYVTYIDTVNKLNPHPEFGPIRCGNLCVHGDTYVNTDLGPVAIRELADQYANIWNGEDYKCVLVSETGRAKGYEVILKNGPTIKVTPEHKFFLKDGTIKQTSELKEGSELLYFRTPKCIKTGTEQYNELVEFLREELNSDLVLVDIPHFLQYHIRVETNKVDKIFISLASLGINCRINKGSIRLTSIMFTLPNIDRLIEHGIISSKKLDKLGVSYKLDRQRLGKKLYYSDYNNFIVDKVNLLPGEFMSYCATEDSRNVLTFNGIVTGNCQEVMLPANENEMAVCNLGSVNIARVYAMGNVDKQLLNKVVRTATKYLDRTIDLTEYPTEDARRTQERIRSIGLGVVGEAEAIAHLKIHYGSEEHINFIDETYGFIRDVAHRTSIDLASEFGPCEAIATPPVRNGYLMCIAPNTNTGIFASTTSGCEPVFGLEWLEDHPNLGSVRMTAPNVNLDNFSYYKHGFALDQYRMIDACSARQKHIDMSISFSLFLNTDGISAKELGRLYLYAWSKGVKSMYYIRSEGVKETTKSDCENCAN